MSEASRIASANTVLAFEAAQRRAAKNGERLYWNDVYRSMAAQLKDAPDEKGEKPAKPRTWHTIGRIVRFYIAKPDRRVWRVDYLEAFAQAVGVTPDRLLRLG